MVRAFTVQGSLVVAVLGASCGRIGFDDPRAIIDARAPDARPFIDGGPCIAGTDSDLDGVDCPADCDDADSRVYPLQPTFFETPRANGSWDFDCDGIEELQDPDMFTTCGDDGAGHCSGGGWIDPAPPCGGSGDRWACSGDIGACQLSNTGLLTPQGCR
jgi:hypothetical protein